MEECKVSIIIAVYNVEKYLKKCMDSVVNQSYQNLEIICVNDGSTDNSLHILNSYARNDERIKIISQENRGLGAARNVGLNAATGDYVYIMDSDDYICLDAIEEMLESAVLNDSEVVIIRYTRIKGLDRVKNKNICNLNGVLNKSGDDYKRFVFTYKDIKNNVLNTFYNVWIAFYKKEFLDSFEKPYFQEGIYYEDVLFHVKVFLKAKRMSHIPKIYYFYRRNPNSIMSHSSYNFDIFKIIDSVEQYLIENDFYGEFKDELDLFKITQGLFYIGQSNNEEFFQATKDLFSKINLSPEHIVDNHKLKKYNWVLESETYVQYLKELYNYELASSKAKLKSSQEDNDKLTRRNEKLKNKNTKLTKKNQKLKNKNGKLVNSNNKLKNKNELMKEKTRSLKSENNSLINLNSSLLNSTSWKITSPFRKLTNFFKKQ